VLPQQSELEELDAPGAVDVESPEDLTGSSLWIPGGYDHKAET
jgi:hypothetical protein